MWECCRWPCFRPSSQDYEVEGWDQLPADIVGVLFEQFGQRKDAKIMRLVCRAWRTASKYHIKSITLKTHHSNLHQLPTVLPALNDINLGDVRSCDEVLHLLRTLPGLTKLNLHCTHAFKCPDSINLQQSRVLDLTIGSCSPFVPVSDTVKLAVLFPNLLKLRILKFGPYRVDNSSFSMLTMLSKLVELEIPTATNIDNKFIASMSLTKLVYGYSEALKVQNISPLQGLQHLSLPCCVMHSQTPMLSELVQLTCLELRGAKIIDDDLRHLTRLRNLCTLIISSCKYLLGTGLSQLHSLSSLRCVDISHCWAVDDEGMLGLGLLTSLTDLRMSRCRYVTHVGAVALTSLANLRYLDASDCHAIHYDGAGWIFRLGCLEAVNFARSPISFARSVEGRGFVSGSVPVESIDLAESGEIAVLVPLLTHLTALRSLNLNGVWGVEDGLGVCLLAMPNLTSLDLGSSASVTDELLKSVGKILSLASLGVSGCTSLTDKGLSELRKLRGLRNLGLALSSAICLAWVDKIPSLTRLDVSNSQVLASHHLRKISGIKNLTHLLCCGCNHVHIEAFSKLQRLRHLETVDARGLGCVQRGDIQRIFSNLNIKVV